MNDSRTFKKGEAVIIHDGTNKRSSIELAQVGADCWYGSDEVLVNFGHFNISYSKANVHKLPASLKKKLKELESTKLKEG